MKDQFWRDFNPYRLFLIDGLGALLSAIMLGLVLPFFYAFIGLPLLVLYVLAVPAVIFCIYSLLCAYGKPKHWQKWMKTIAVLNLIYCLATAALLLLHSDQLVWLGWVYFIGEFAIVIGLATIEIKKSNL